MKVYVVLAHPEHQSFNGAMFRTAVETFASAAAEEYCRRAAVRGRDLLKGCGARSALQ